MIHTEWHDPLPSIINDAIRPGMEEVLTRTVNEAKSIASGFKDPTGRTLNSIMWQMDGEEFGFAGSPATTADKLNEPKKKLVAYIGTNISNPPYPIYVENGTRFSRPHPFIRPAIALHIQGRSIYEVIKRWEQMRASGPLKRGEVRDF